MTQKDFIKLILCMHGYDRNINIEISNLGVYGTLYDISADNTDKTDNVSVYENGFYFAIYSLLEQFKCKNLNPFYLDVPLKSIFDDNIREQIIDTNIKNQLKLKNYLSNIKPIDKFISDHNICKNCKLNNKSHWDDIHYNCELNHNNTCKYLLEFNKLTYELFQTNNDPEKIEYIKNLENKIIELYNKTTN